MIWLVFLAVEIGGFIFITFKYQRRNPLYYIIIIYLCICPLVPAFGQSNFCMRTSIPGLLIMNLYVLDAIYEMYISRNKMIIAAAIILLLGAVTPFHEFSRSIRETWIAYVDNTPVRHDCLDEDGMLQNQYESVDTKDNLFYKYLAK